MFDMVHTSIARGGAEKRIVDAVRSMLAGRPMRGALAVEAAKVWNEVIAAASRAAVPTLMTTTGQALVFCVIELAFRPPDHARVRDAIGARVRQPQTARTSSRDTLGPRPVVSRPTVLRIRAVLRAPRPVV